MIKVMRVAVTNKTKNVQWLKYNGSLFIPEVKSKMDAPD